MPTIIETSVTWIGQEFGGNPHMPVVGLRPTIRFQRNVGAWLKTAWDVEIEHIELDPKTWRGTARFVFSKSAQPDMDHLRKAELIELLDAYRVIGVGKILSVEFRP